MRCSALGVAMFVWVAPIATTARAAEGAAKPEPEAPSSHLPPPTPAPDERLRPLVPEPGPRAMLPDRIRCGRVPGVRARVCDSPRRGPEPTPEAAARAARLGLGTHAAADILSTRAPPEAWIEEVGAAPQPDMLWPVANGLLSRRFGAARLRASAPGLHPGVDIVAPEGTLLRAVNDGLVAYADNGIRGMGNSLWLVHGDGSVSVYAHCRALHVSAGEIVRRGQVVGELGATGLTFRAHLHFEWRVGGRPQDPMPRFVERPSWPLRVEERGEVRWLAPPPNRREPEVASQSNGEEETTAATGGA